MLLDVEEIVTFTILLLNFGMNFTLESGCWEKEDLKYTNEYVFNEKGSLRAFK